MKSLCSEEHPVGSPHEQANAEFVRDEVKGKIGHHPLRRSGWDFTPSFKTASRDKPWEPFLSRDRNVRAHSGAQSSIPMRSQAAFLVTSATAAVASSTTWLKLVCTSVAKLTNSCPRSRSLSESTVASSICRDRN